MEGIRIGRMDIQKQEGRYWGFAYVRSCAEKKVQTSLISMGIPHYLPTVSKARMQHSTKIISRVPMISGYIFLSASDFERSELKRREERIVNIELLRNECQENIFINELNALKQCEELALDAPISINPDIIADDEVMITSGPLVGLQTTVVSRNDAQDIIVVNLTILNKHVEYPVSAELLKKITA